MSNCCQLSLLYLVGYRATAAGLIVAKVIMTSTFLPAWGMEVASCRCINSAMVTDYRNLNDPIKFI